MNRFPLLILISVLLAGCSGQSGTGGSGGDGATGGPDPDPNLPTTGIPDLDSFSLSIEVTSIEGFDFDGATTTLTIRLADRLNQNTVPNGTDVFFTTEGGDIDEFCSLSNGACTVTLESQNPRPADGRVTVLAWTTGNESFLDQDADGVYGDSDDFDDIPSRRDLSEPFRDDNFDGNHDNDEEFQDFDGLGSFNGPDGLFNGNFCEHTTDCSPNQSLFIWENIEVVFSSRNALITVTPDPVVPGPVTLSVTDINGNPMAVGTTIDIETDNELLPDITSFTVGTDFGTSALFTAVTDGTSDTASFLVRVTSPESGAVTILSTTYTD